MHLYTCKCDSFPFLYRLKDDTWDNEMITIPLAAYINNYCVRYIPIAQHTSVFIIAQGGLLTLPHFVWNAYNTGGVVGFFSITGKLNQVENQIFCYDNVLQVETLYDHFKPRHRIYLSYVMKLLLQLFFCVASFFISAWIFTDFSPSFLCPDTTSDG